MNSVAAALVGVLAGLLVGSLGVWAVIRAAIEGGNQ